MQLLPQIIPPHDSGIQQSIEDNLEPWEGAWDTEKATADPRLSDPLEEMSGKYFAKLSASMLDKEMNAASPINFTVTAMHGVSHDYMVEAFRICGFKVCVFLTLLNPFHYVVKRALCLLLFLI